MDEIRQELGKSIGLTEEEMRAAEPAYVPPCVPIAECTTTGYVGVDGNLVLVDPGIPLADFLAQKPVGWKPSRMEDGGNREARIPQHPEPPHLEHP
jgi:hypothetical protein